MAPSNGQDLANKYLGVGFGFPFNVNEAGSVGRAYGTDAVNYALAQILGTVLRERIMRRDWGTDNTDIVFDPSEPNLNRIIEAAVKTAVRQWEPRVEVTNIGVLRDDDEGHVFTKVDWIQLGTHVKGSLVYPFYLAKEA